MLIQKTHNISSTLRGTFQDIANYDKFYIQNYKHYLLDKKQQQKL